MKNIKYIIAILIISMMGLSCDMDQFPESDLDKNGSITDEEGLENLMVGVYNSMQTIMESEWSVTENRSDNTRQYSANSSSVTSIALLQLDQNVMGTDNTYIIDYWNALYKTITLCNDVLQYIDVVQDEDAKERIKTEAMYIRSYHYFKITQLWGGLFLVTKPMTQQEYRTLDRISIDQSYDFIEEELEYVVETAKLPVHGAYPNSGVGKATLTAAKMTLAKVYMTRYALDKGNVKYLAARTLLGEALAEVGAPTAAANLVPFGKIFDTSNEMSNEIIFAVRYSAVNKGIGSKFSNMFSPSNSGTSIVIGRTYSHNYPSDDILLAFNQSGAADIRKALSFKENYVNAMGQLITKDPCRYVYKYLDQKLMTENDGENDWPLLRIGDLTLLYAEIINEIDGPTADAFTYLNMTRERAGLQPYTAAELIDKTAFSDALKTERRLELAFENHRFFDLLRWGDAANVLNEVYKSEIMYVDLGTKDIKETHLKLPIPVNILNINVNVAQNPGY